MDRIESTSRNRWLSRSRWRSRSAVALVVLSLGTGAVLGACSSQSIGGTSMSPTAMATMTPTAMAAVASAATPATGTDAGAGGSSMASASTTAMLPAEAEAAAAGGETMRADANEVWATRPDFTKASSDTEEAYAYALYKPSIVQWMPCYCGCQAMDHRSNLDCYLKPMSGTGSTQFEEHASYCDVCVKTTLLTKQMVAQGKTLREIRAAVDATFAGNAPGTKTPLPPG